MSAIQILILVIFGLDTIVHLYGQYLRIKGKEKPGQLIEFITKPLLMPILIVFYLTYLPAVNWWYIAGIIGGFLGDVFLMLPDPSGKKTAFKIGLVAFLLGHVFYIVALIQNYIAWVQISWEYIGFPWLPLVLAAAYIVYGLIIGFKLLPHCGKLKIAVLVYLIVIVLMGISTTILGWEGISTGVIILIVGAWLFVISDTFNAFNKFAKPIKNERLITMSSYILGQFLMLLGFIIITHLPVFS
ncbi:MAG: lysoplasmalogenase [Promethearchaeota archaeon]